MTRRSLRILATALLALSPAAASALEVRVLSSVGTGVPDPSEKLVKLGEEVTLFAAARDRSLGTVAAAPKVVWAAGSKPVAAKGPEGLSARIRWFKVEPTQHSLSNTDPSFHWEELAYQDTPMPECDDRWTCRADVRTTVLGDRGGLGTMAFKVEVEVGDLRAASPGSEKRFRGGLTTETARVTVRRDDTYLGFLTELFNTPYIWGSAGVPDEVHQADRRIGSDCADFVTYGARRMGQKVAYGSTWDLAKRAKHVASAPKPGPDGLYRNAKGEPIEIGPKAVREGDLLLFPRHVGALVRDEEPKGVLSTSDILIHTCWNEPTEQPLSESGWGDVPVQILRWKVLDR